jgi:hypothetical protein
VWFKIKIISCYGSKLSEIRKEIMEKQMRKYRMSKDTEKKLKQSVFQAEKEFWTDANKRWKREFGEKGHYNPTEEAIGYTQESNWTYIKDFFCEVGQSVLDRRLLLWCEGSSGMMWKCAYFHAYSKKNKLVVPGSRVYICGAKARALSPYWSFRHECFHVCCYGTSRPLEIILGIGNALGIPWYSIHQDQQVL